MGRVKSEFVHLGPKIYMSLVLDLTSDGTFIFLPPWVPLDSFWHSGKLAPVPGLCGESGMNVLAESREDLAAVDRSFFFLLLSSVCVVC